MPQPSLLLDSGAALSAASLLAQRNNFLNLFGGTTDLALMEQELALNPHLLQRLAGDPDLGSQLMKFNSELTGFGGSNSNGGSLLGAPPSHLGGGGGHSLEKQMSTSSMMMSTPASYDASNSCDNSQDGE